MLQSQITDLQDNVIVTGTNLGVGPGTFTMLTTGTNNVAVGNGAAGGQYGIQTGSGNVAVGASAGGSCESGSNNTFLGYNTGFKSGVSYYNGSIHEAQGP